MGSVSSTINLIISGSTRGLAAASAEAEAAARRVADAEDRASAARTRAAAADGRVEAAEAHLGAVRSQQEAALSRVGVAETNLERVRTSTVGSATRLSQAEADLDRIRQTGSTEQIEAAEERVNRVRTESDLAAQRLQQAEAALATARGNAERSSSRVAAAEAAIARARAEAVRASEASARADNDLDLIRRRSTADTDRQRSGLLGLFDAFTRLGDAVSGADDASNKFLSTASALQGLFGQIGGPIAQAVVGLVEMVAIFGALVEIVGVVGGLIGQALGGIPVLLVSIGLAAATVALGMDGIKKAAEAAAPAFDKLKKSVSDTFEKQLTPFFLRVGQVLPQVTQGFDNVAVAVSQVAKEVIAFVTSARGIADINAALAGTAALVKNLAPGIAIFVKGLLDATASAKTGLADIGTAIGSVFAKIGDVFTKLGADGTINKAVEGLAATITGLGDVLAPIISLLIQMGAALGDSVGKALTDVGAGIEQVTPFFVQLADVAGKVLVDAFTQLGPPIRELIDTILPGAGQGLDGFASLMHNVVLPAVADFINWIRTDGIPGFIAFSQAVIINATSAASAILGFVSSALAALEELVKFTAVFTNNPALLKLAGDIEVAKTKVDGLKTSIDTIHDKTVTAAVTTSGEPQVHALVDRMAEVKDKTVAATANVPSGPLVGEQGVLAVNAAMDAAHDKTVTHTANVPSGPVVGEQGVLAVNAAIDAAHDKTVTHTANVPSGPVVGEQGVLAVNAAIDAAHDKTVTATANAVGESAVRALQSAMDQLHDVTVTVTTVVKQIIGLRKGGRAPTSEPFLVGEEGPELLTLDAFGGVVTPADKTRQLLNQQAAAGAVGGSALPSTSGDQPITVNVMISPTEIAGIAQVEIQRRDRATKRTVLAGSGATF